jgi:hypothetical protein
MSMKRTVMLASAVVCMALAAPVHAGGYLALPPIAQPLNDIYTAAPLMQWTYLSSFDTAEQYNVTQMDLLKHGRAYSPMYYCVPNGRCIASDDRRLAA